MLHCSFRRSKAFPHINFQLLKCAEASELQASEARKKICLAYRGLVTGSIEYSTHNIAKVGFETLLALLLSCCGLA